MMVKLKSPILNQKSFKVSRVKFDNFKIKLSNNINKDIVDTLKQLKFLY